MCWVFLGRIGGATTFASAKVKNAIGRIGIFQVRFVGSLTILGGVKRQESSRIEQVGLGQVGKSGLIRIPREFEQNHIEMVLTPSSIHVGFWIILAIFQPKKVWLSFCKKFLEVVNALYLMKALSPHAGSLLGNFRQSSSVSTWRSSQEFLFH